jgi:allantoinase
MIVSDHSPCPPEMKLREQGDFMKAWGGISSLQLRLADNLDGGKRARLFD